MRVLIIHPQDELAGQPWASQKWDRVIDLGHGGIRAYAQAASLFGCPVTSIDEFRENFHEMGKIRDLLAIGRGRVNDRFGLDWWELTSLYLHQQLEDVVLLEALAATFNADDDIYLSRPGFHATALGLETGRHVSTFPLPQREQKRGAGHYLRLLKKFTPGQLMEIFWDKTDSGYQFRGRFSARQKASPDSVVLLPSAYGNVSRVGFGYASGLPDTRFLLVATRRSGWIPNPPANVSMKWLRGYASLRDPERELERRDLMQRWVSLQNELTAVPELKKLHQGGYFNEFPDWIARGLEIRDAWRNVLGSEPVQAVICADDTNRNTHIPLLLAKQNGLPTISCHHGALDGRYMFKRNHADVLLVKGRMEQDYLVRVCGVPREKVEIGAPSLPTVVKQESSPRVKPFIVLFSEVYELSGGRARDSYEDILPSLADLAISQGRQFLIKLHPAESLTERQSLVASILRPEQQRVTRVVAGPLQIDMLDNAWFGITVLSTVAVECVLRGVPCFLCTWLESWPYGYVDQFTRFGVGIPLKHPKEIEAIPTMLKNYKVSDAVRADCWRPIETERFRAMLGQDRKPRTAAVKQDDVLKGA